MSGQGLKNPYIHFAVSMAFILIGDLCLYGIGRRISRNAETPSKWQKVLTPERQAKVQGLFDKYGSWAVFFGRFVAGVRAAVFLSAGMARFPVGKFIFFDLLAAAISVPVWIWIGYAASSNWEVLAEKAQKYQFMILGVGLVRVVSGFWYIKRRHRKKAEQAATLEENALRTADTEADTAPAPSQATQAQSEIPASDDGSEAAPAESAEPDPPADA